MTKDNWIKAFDEFLLTLDIRLLFSDRNKLEAFISQVEKDAEQRGYDIAKRELSVKYGGQG